MEVIYFRRRCPHDQGESAFYPPEVQCFYVPVEDIIFYRHLNHASTNNPGNGQAYDSIQAIPKFFTQDVEALKEASIITNMARQKSTSITRINGAEISEAGVLKVDEKYIQAMITKVKSIKTAPRDLEERIGFLIHKVDNQQKIIKK